MYQKKVTSANTNGILEHYKSSEIVQELAAFTVKISTEGASFESTPLRLAMALFTASNPGRLP
jgi:hypothetical protein